MPEPSRLDVTIARLKAIAGDDRVGSPVLEDTYQPGAFHVAGFRVKNPVAREAATQPRIALRRVRPPIEVRMLLNAGQPAMFHDGRQSYRVTTCFGPWRSSGCWWSQAGWDQEEWDVLAQPKDSTERVCLLVMDRLSNQWRLEAFYD